MLRFLWQWRTHSLAVGLYIGATVAASVLCFAVSPGSLVGGTTTPLTLLTFAGLLFAAELMAVRLPRGGAVSVSLAISLVSVALFPPRWALAVNAAGVMLAKLLWKRPLDVVAFNGSQIALSTAAGQVVMHALDRGHAFSYPHSVLPFLVGSLAYVIANLSLNAGILLIERKGSFLDIWWFNLRATLLPFLTLTALALLLVVVYLSPLRVLGVLLLFGPLALARYSLLEYVKLRESHVETIEALAAALDARDQYTKGHSDRVADLAVAVAQELHLRPGAIEDIRFAALLHDLGKVGVRDDVLNKPGRLTMPELELIRSHARLGADIIQKVSFLREVSRMVRYHHQWFDGSGYPGGLSREEIPIGARILAVCDAWDAMTTDRVYRKALTPLRALNELQMGAGTQFDPRVVEAFATVAQRRGLLRSSSAEVAATAAASGERPVSSEVTASVHEQQTAQPYLPPVSDTPRAGPEV
ncbi:MAG: HD-GYP domain-containing protein [Limnochordaceae bacterium]|nr:HD-GYP domain-containing protein [Limnochordaceae bacterium]